MYVHAALAVVARCGKTSAAFLKIPQARPVSGASSIHAPLTLSPGCTARSGLCGNFLFGAHLHWTCLHPPECTRPKADASVTKCSEAPARSVERGHTRSRA